MQARVSSSQDGLHNITEETPMLIKSRSQLLAGQNYFPGPTKTQSVVEIYIDLLAEVGFLIGSVLFWCQSQTQRKIGAGIFAMASLLYVYSDGVKALQAKATSYSLMMVWIAATIGSMGFAVFSLLLICIPDKDDSWYFGLVAAAALFMVRSIGLAVVGYRQQGLHFWTHMPAAFLEFIATSLFFAGCICLMYPDPIMQMGRQLFMIGSTLSCGAMVLISLSFYKARKTTHGPRKSG